ncbi:hypothetical protein PGB90_008642 [Kerria lacca]
MELPFSKPRSAQEANINASKKQKKPSSVSYTKIHSKIEKRRRDKMNSYLMKLSTMIPSACNTSTNKRKIDKITLLNIALQYLKSIQLSSMRLNSQESIKKSLLTEAELKRLMLQMSQGFIFVISCDTARILFVSESASKILHCNRLNLFGRCLYDIIHLDDIANVKEQISHAESNCGRHEFVDLNLIKDLELEIPGEQLGMQPGNRRSFFFRIKSNIEKADFQNNSNEDQVLASSFNTNITSSEQNKYNIIQCVGYIKRWHSINNKFIMLDKLENMTSVTSLIAVGRKLFDNFSHVYDEIGNPLTFVSKHTLDGKFLFVDHWITIITGYLPQEVLGTNMYDYIHSEDLKEFAESHCFMLQHGNNLLNFRFRVKFGTYIRIRSEWKSLLNPWKKDVEYLYSKNMVVNRGDIF